MVFRVPIALVAAAGAAMLASASAPSEAFTLSSASLAQPMLAGGVEQAWWDRWGRWHPNWGWGWRRPYHWGPPPYYWGPPRRHWGWGPRRHCWWTGWGRRCAWR